MSIFESFNGSIWHALWILGPLGIVVFVVMLFRLGPGNYYFFDPRHANPTKKDVGDFGPHSARYQDLAKLIITLSAAAIAFLIGVMANEKANENLTAFIQRIEASAPIVVGFFAACIACLVSFMVTQDVWYEQYCHSEKNDTYSAWKYALSASLGWSGLLSFVIGFVWLAENLFHS